MEGNEEQGIKAGSVPLVPQTVPQPVPGICPPLSPNLSPALSPPDLIYGSLGLKPGTYCRYPRGRAWLPAEVEAKKRAEARKAAWRAAAPERAAAAAQKAQNKQKLQARRRRIIEGNASMAAALERASAKLPGYDHAKAQEETRRLERDRHRKKRKGVDLSGHEGGRKVGNKVVPIPGEKSDIKQVNIRHDVLEFMFACRRISAGEKGAGEWMRELLMLCEAPGPRSPPFGQVAIQSSARPGMPVKPAVFRARKELERLKVALGADGYSLMQVALLTNRTLPVLAQEIFRDRARQSKTAKKNLEWYLGERFRECLRTLVFHISAGGKSTGKITGWVAPGAKPGNVPEAREIEGT